MKTLFLFPGQGSQYVGMGKDFFQNHDEVKQTFLEADDALGERFSDLVFQGPDDVLLQTQNAQPAILTVSVAIGRWIKKNFNLTPICMAGHSLGEYSALVMSDVISFHDAVQMVRARGQFMQECVPLGLGTMAAVLGMEDDAVERICAEITAQGDLVEPANYNSPGQLVISGTVAGVQKASFLCKERGALKVVPLKVSAPFHSSLLQPAGDRLREKLGEYRFQTPSVPYVCNVDASTITEASRTVDLLCQQVWKPVRWTQSLKAMFEAFPATPVIEIGPGRVIAGHIKKIDKNRTVLTTDTLACESALIELLKTQ